MQSMPRAVRKCQACLAHLMWTCSQPGLSMGTAAGMHAWLCSRASLLPMRVTLLPRAAS